MPERSFRKKRPQNKVEYVPKKQVQQLVQKAANVAVNNVNSNPRRQKAKPKRATITPAGKMLRRVGGLAGTFLGNAQLGTQLGAGISRIFGQGDYKIKENSLVSGGPPAFAALNSGIRISHREYIADVTSSTAFANTTYDINPANSLTFPWLSKIARNFEEYDIKGIVFYFNTTSGNAVSSTNNALGTVGLVTVYDPTDPALSTKRECEDYGGCVAGVPANSILHPIECKPRANVLDRLYIQLEELADAEDKKFYSHGTLNVFTQGMQAAGVTIGELWVSYDIHFYNPKILPIGTIDSAASKVYASTTTQDANKVMGSTDITLLGNLGVTYSGTAGNFTIPKGTAPGYYFFNMMASSGSTACLYQKGLTSSNMTWVNLMQGNSEGITSTPNAATANAWHGVSGYLYKTDTQAATFTVQWQTAIPSGTVAADISVYKVPSSALTGAAGGYSKPQTLGDLILIKTLKRLGFEPRNIVNSNLSDHEFSHDELE